MPTNSLIRKYAAETIKKMIPQAFAIAGILLLAYMLSAGLFQLNSLVFGKGMLARIFIYILNVFFSLVFITPISLGIMRFFWRITGGADDSILSCFYYFSSAGKYKISFSLALNRFIRIYLIQIIVTLPTFFFENLDFNMLFQQNILSNIYQSTLFAIFILLRILVIFVVAWLGLRYFLAEFLLFNDETLTANQAMAMSFQIMKKRVVKTIGFLLGYFGWTLLCALVLPILYVLPFTMLGTAIYARYTITDYNFNLIKGGIQYNGWTYNQ